MASQRTATLTGLAAILLWASLAVLTTATGNLPPFQVLAVSFGIAALLGLARAALRGATGWRELRQPGAALALSTLALFGYHALYFIALKRAPAVEANLLNYLWPLGMVLLAPVWLRGVQWRWLHVVAALAGFAGAALALLDGMASSSPLQTLPDHATTWWGYALAIGAAFTWASYSLLTQRVPAFKTSAVGTFCLVSGILALLCHMAFETTPALSLWDWSLIGILGLGPLGGAFFLWDAALKRADARTIGLLAFITPLLSTALLLRSRGQPLSATLAMATVLIVGAALVGTRAK